jgi:hypothetical protein
MFSSVEAGGQVGEVKAYTTSGRGLNVEELADMAMRKLIHVADTAAPALAGPGPHVQAASPRF